jgi:hypothetical protein
LPLAARERKIKLCPRFFFCPPARPPALPVAPAVFAVYGGLFGALGVRVSLLNGVTSVGPAAPLLEGANFTIGVLGNDVLVAVQGGVARVVGSSV